MFVFCVGVSRAESVEGGLKIEFVEIENGSELLVDWPTRLVGRKKLHSREYWDFDGSDDDLTRPIKYWFGPVHGAYCKAIKLTGRIKSGDAARLDVFLESLSERSTVEQEIIKSSKPVCFRPDYRAARNDPVAVDLLLLDFQGGNLAEALEIIQTLPAMTTVVPKGGRCVSACALVFLSGRYLIDNEGSSPSNYATSRWMHVDSDVGFHAPQPDFGRSHENKTDTLNNVYKFSFQQAITLSKVLTTELDDSVLDLVASEDSLTDYAMIDSVQEAWRFNIDIFGYQYDVGRDDKGRLKPKSALTMCANAWNFHTDVIETAFDEINAGFSEFSDANIVELSDPDKVSEIQFSVDDDLEYFYVRKRSEIVVYENYGHARYPELRKCSVGYLGGRGREDRHFSVSIEAHRSIDEPIFVPSWYAYNSDMPLRLTEYEK